MKYIYFFLAVLFVSIPIFAQVIGDYRTGQASVTWSTAAHWQTWDGDSWETTSSKPGSTNSVYIQRGHTVTLTGNEACLDLHLNKDNSQNRLALGTNTLEINGKIRAYTGSAGIIPGTSSTSPGGNDNWITSTTGKISVVGNSRNLTIAGEWGVGVANVSSPNGFDLEINLSSGQTATFNTFFKCRSFNVVSGTLHMAVDARMAPAQNTRANSNFIIQSGATVISAASGSATDVVFAYDDDSLSDTLWVKSGGKLVLTGESPYIGMNTIIFDGTVEYGREGNQSTAARAHNGAFANLLTNLIISGSGTKTIVNANFTVNGTFSIQGSATLNNNGANFTYGESSILEYASSTANQTMSTNEFNTTGSRVPPNLIINNTFGTVTLNANRTTFAGNINVTAGTFDLSTFTINRSSVGGSLTVSNGATLKIGGINTLPSNYSTHSIGELSTIEYSGTNQNIASLNSSQNYGNLIISGSGTKTASAAIQTHTDGDITITGTLANDGFDISCGGNVLGNGTMTGTGNLVMLTHAKSVSAAALSNLKLNLGGNVNLSASLNITGSLNFVLGTLSLGANNLTLNSGASITGHSNTAYIITNSTGVLTRNSVGASNTIFPVGTTSSYNPVTLNNAGTSDNFSVRVKTAFDNTPNIPAQVVNRSWDISESVVGGSNVTVTLQWNGDEEAGSFARNDGLHISRYTGAEWLNTSASLTGTGPYTATSSNFTSFSEFGVGSEGALPVELTSFTASLSGHVAILNWQTATEINNYGFEVQKSVVSSQNSEESWENIGFVQGHGTTNSPKDYEFTDSELPDADEVSYRLKQIDNDGAFAYSKIVTVDLTTITSIDDDIFYQFELMQNYPNPFNPSTTIRFTVANVGISRDLSLQTNLTVYNSLGQQVATLVNEQKPPGNYEITFDANKLASGIYFYRLSTGNFIQTKKMLLIK